jgi:hypothetical protein
VGLLSENQMALFTCDYLFFPRRGSESGGLNSSGNLSAVLALLVHTYLPHARTRPRTNILVIYIYFYTYIPA